MEERESKTYVVKIGSALATQEGYLENIAQQIKTILETTKSKIHFVLVISGAIPTGESLYPEKVEDSFSNESEKLAYKQVMASLGQPQLAVQIQDVFRQVNLVCGQDLLSRHNFTNTTEKTNLQQALQKSFQMGVIPVVNENDTTAVSEIKFGDNDQLSAAVADSVNADELVNLTSSDGIYKKVRDKKVCFKSIRLSKLNRTSLRDKLFHYFRPSLDTQFQERHFETEKTKTGTGGPQTKHAAAKIFVNNSKRKMHIANGNEPDILKKVFGITDTDTKTWTTYTP